MSSPFSYFRCVVCVLCLIGPIELSAGPPHFLPGDAFFSGRMNTRINPDVPIDGVLLLHYELPPGWGGLNKFSCGTLRLKLTGIAAKEWKVWRDGIDSIRRVDKETLVVLRSEGGMPPEEIVEENPLYVFVYPRDFKISELRPFMRYNEDWSDECSELGVPLAEQCLPSFYRDSGQREWRDAKLVPRLPVTFGSREDEKADRSRTVPRHGSQEGSVHPEGRDSASFPYDKAMIVLVSGQTLRDLKDRDDPDLMPGAGESIIVIRDSQWDRYYSTGKGWSLSRDDGDESVN